LRPVGSVSIARWPKFVPTSLEVVSTTAARAVTVIASDAPTCNLRSTCASRPSSTRTSRSFAGLKPSSMAVTV
jgi:hypothetical protein